MITEATIGRYTLESRIALGGMAAVFLGRMAGPGGFTKQVVVKRILDEHAGNPAFVEMFLGEARLAALLNHPNVVQVYDFGEDQGRYYLAMELVDGASVRALLERQRKIGQPFPPRVAACIAAMACAGLGYAHALKDETGQPLNLVHRDVSPDNLLASRAGVVKLADFGVARVATATATKTRPGEVKGKVAYMSPEQVRGEPIDHRADQFSLGVTLYELLCGERPFTAPGDLELAITILEREAKPLGERAPGLHPHLAAIVERAMQKDRERRFADMNAMQRALDEWLGNAHDAAGDLRVLVQETKNAIGDLTVLAHEAVPPAGAPPPAPVARRSSLPTLIVAVVVAALLGLAGGRWLFAAPPAVVIAPPLPRAEVAPAAAPTPPPVEAAPAAGSLTLRTTPVADVTLDGESAGPTPLLNLEVSAGTHVVELGNVKLGIASKLVLEVGAGEAVTRSIRFPLGVLKVTAPKGTRVFRGSELLGVAPMPSVTLAVGRQTIGFIDAAGRLTTRSVTIRPTGEAQLTLP